MIHIYNIDRADLWDCVVRSFAKYDVYYLSGYVKAFYLHGDGWPQLLYYEGEDLRAVYVYMKRMTFIAGCYDSITPYGYGGVLFEGNTSDGNLQAFWEAYRAKMRQEGIVDNFVRYHPVLDNARLMRRVSPVTDLGRTVAIDLSSPETVWENLTRRNREQIREAEARGIEIRHGKDLSLFTEFRRMYDAMQTEEKAKEYFRFGDDFYRSIHRDLQENYEMFYAVLEGEIVAMSIILHANGRMHCHLSGVTAGGRDLSAQNLLLYRAALWGCERGLRTFHLGGGVGAAEDSLYRFKASFNRKADYRFSVGKEIFDERMYEELVRTRMELDSGFNRDGSFFPVYRFQM